ncbi:hypothetical protein [Candidatus Nitrospira bockiana]
MTMNAIALFLALVLQGNPTCALQPTTETFQADGSVFQIDYYDCYWRGSGEASHQFVVWSLVCPGYVGPPVLLKERNLRKGWAMNQFGEFYPATVNIDMMEVYHPHCE